MMARSRNAERIREQNDQARKARLGETYGAARWLLSSGIVALGPERAQEAVRRVSEFDAFDHGNDPHGEHDFGAFELDGEQVFWKIDYYDRSMKIGSEDPSDEAITCRVLTIMLASEY